MYFGLVFQEDRGVIFLHSIPIEAVLAIWIRAAELASRLCMKFDMGHHEWLISLYNILAILAHISYCFIFPMFFLEMNKETSTTKANREKPDRTFGAQIPLCGLGFQGVVILVYVQLVLAHISRKGPTPYLRADQVLPRHLSL